MPHPNRKKRVGSSFFFHRAGKLQLEDPAFQAVWNTLARTAIYGGICLDDGYAATRWKTVEIISNIGSTADILYQPEQVIYPDNTTQTQRDYETALRQLDLVQGELEQLTAAQHREIVLEEYEFFLSNLGSLTATEHKVYELYLAGNNAKQIAQQLGISPNTLKYHNKNIYSKLGISSRKQMLRFAALKQHRDAQAKTN